MPQTLVAELPPMKKNDLERFEKEGGVWGQQRQIRRRQVYTACFGAATFSVLGYAYACATRRNTTLVGLCTLPVFMVAGAVVGNEIGCLMNPSVADNRETTMMRRLWWAKECSKNWTVDACGKDKWVEQYPKLDPAVVKVQ